MGLELGAVGEETDLGDNCRDEWQRFEDVLAATFSCT